MHSFEHSLFCIYRYIVYNCAEMHKVVRHIHTRAKARNFVPVQQEGLQVDLASRLAIRGQQTAEKQFVDHKSQSSRRWALGLAVRLIAISVLPIVLGILLDSRLQTSPIITLSMMLLSLNLGIYMIYQTVSRVYKQFGGTES